VPYPHAWRYQNVNAEYLSSRGAAIILPDEALTEKLSTLIFELIRNPERRRQMRQSMQSLAPPDAAGRIAEVITDLATHA